jgi:hypothetical protein
MRVFKTILQKSSPAAYFICDNGLPSRKILEKHLKSAVLAKMRVKKSAFDGNTFFQLFKRLPKSRNYCLRAFQVLHVLMIRLLATFKRLDLSAEEIHCLIS